MFSYLVKQIADNGEKIMKNRSFRCLFMCILLLLSACSSGGSTTPKGNKNQPEGLYMLAYFCDENGGYVPELNEQADYDGYPSPNGKPW